MGLGVAVRHCGQTSGIVYLTWTLVDILLSISRHCPPAAGIINFPTHKAES